MGENSSSLEGASFVDARMKLLAMPSTVLSHPAVWPRKADWSGPILSLWTLLQWEPWISMGKTVGADVGTQLLGLIPQSAWRQLFVCEGWPALSFMIGRGGDDSAIFEGGRYLIEEWHYHSQWWWFQNAVSDLCKASMVLMLYHVIFDHVIPDYAVYSHTVACHIIAFREIKLQSTLTRINER